MENKDDIFFSFDEEEYEEINEEFNIPSSVPYLWRLSRKENLSSESETSKHYKLRKSERSISLFSLCEAFRQTHMATLKEEGAVYLYFMFQIVFMKKPKKMREIQEQISIQLDLQALKARANSSEIFKKCFKSIVMSEKQKYQEQACHYDMSFNDEQLCNSRDMQVFLDKSTKMSPEVQDDSFKQCIWKYMNGT